MSDEYFSESDLEWSSDDNGLEEVLSADEDNNFSHHSEIRPAPKSFTLDDLWDLQKSIAEEVSDVLRIPSDVCWFFLHIEKWQKEELINSFVLHPEKYSSQFESSILKEHRSIMCPLCCERAAGYCLDCDHPVCKDCFMEYMKYRVSDQEIFSAVCPGDADCKRIIGPSISTQLQVPNYAITGALIFLTRQKQIKGCPSRDCSLYHLLCETEILCKCGTTLCGSCGYFSHAPISCSVAESWVALFANEKELLLKSNANTKLCPNCSLVIEKTEGCKHMLCRCGYHFCWLCMGEYINRGHVCPVTGSEKRGYAKERFALLAPKYSSNLADMKYHYSVDASTVNISAAHRVARNSRQLLAWTYALLFYISYSNQRLMLENNLTDLDNATDKLAKLIKHDSLVDDIQVQASYVEERRRTLQEYVVSTKWKLEKTLRL